MTSLLELDNFHQIAALNCRKLGTGHISFEMYHVATHQTCVYLTGHIWYSFISLSESVFGGTVHEENIY
jgi:hypothetical protein